MKVEERKKYILSAVIDSYIKTGEPVGSMAVMQQLLFDVSSATIRNDMAALEKEGFLEQPYTSAGRVPTYKGYRFYIDNLMSPKPLSEKEKKFIDSMLKKSDLTANAIVDNAVTVLSDLTELAAVSKSNTPVFSVITRVEVIPAGKRLYALLIITSAGDIKNKICRMEFDLTDSQIEYFARFINENLTGLSVDKMNPAMLQNLAVALGSYLFALSPLLNAVYELSGEISSAPVTLKGEQKLMSSGVLADDIVKLQSHKNDLDAILSNAFDGISVVFGKENDSFAVTNSSMILSPYKIDDQKAGSLGVIGPVRLDYAKIIPNIQYITKGVSKMLSDLKERKDDEDEQGRDERKGK